MNTRTAVYLVGMFHGVLCGAVVSYSCHRPSHAVFVWLGLVMVSVLAVYYFVTSAEKPISP